MSTRSGSSLMNVSIFLSGFRDLRLVVPVKIQRILQRDQALGPVGFFQRFHDGFLAGPHSRMPQFGQFPEIRSPARIVSPMASPLTPVRSPGSGFCARYSDGGFAALVWLRRSHLRECFATGCYAPLTNRS